MEISDTRSHKLQFAAIEDIRESHLGTYVNYDTIRCF